MGIPLGNTWGSIPVSRALWLELTGLPAEKQDLCTTLGLSVPTCIMGLNGLRLDSQGPRWTLDLLLRQNTGFSES